MLMSSPHAPRLVSTPTPPSPIANPKSINVIKYHASCRPCTTATIPFDNGNRRGTPSGIPSTRYTTRAITPPCVTTTTSFPAYLSENPRNAPEIRSHNPSLLSTPASPSNPPGPPMHSTRAPVRAAPISPPSSCLHSAQKLPLPQRLRTAPRNAKTPPLPP